MDALEQLFKGVSTGETRCGCIFLERHCNWAACSPRVKSHQSLSLGWLTAESHIWKLSTCHFPPSPPSLSGTLLSRADLHCLNSHYSMHFQTATWKPPVNFNRSQQTRYSCACCSYWFPTSSEFALLWTQARSIKGNQKHVKGFHGSKW